MGSAATGCPVAPTDAERTGFALARVQPAAVVPGLLSRLPNAVGAAALFNNGTMERVEMVNPGAPESAILTALQLALGPR